MVRGPKVCCSRARAMTESSPCAAPAAMQRLADLRDQLGRIEKLRLRLIDGQPVQAADLMLLIDRAREAITGERRQTKARLRQARAWWRRLATPTARLRL